MVGVSVKTSHKENASDLAIAKQPLIERMLSDRAEHARNQRHDYSHVFRAKTRCEMARMAAIAMAIEFAYAAETSFVSPILLQIGVDHKHMTMAWGLSPMIGFFLSPLLGSISDRCKLNWGRRRPIITMLSIGIVAGLILVPYGKELGLLLGDAPYTNFAHLNESLSLAMEVIGEEGATPTPPPTAPSHQYAVILTILGMVLLDFDADTCQTPARTYLLDMCIADDQPKALTSFTLFAGLGGTIGYAIGGIDWETTRIGTFMGGNVQTVFGLVTIIFIVCYLITVTTFREIPLKLMEQDEMLRPLSATAIEKELSKNNNAVYYIKENNAEVQNQSVDLSRHPYEYTNGNFNGSISSLAGPMKSYQNGYSPALEKVDVEKPSPSLPIVLEDDADAPVPLGQYLKSIFVMPYSMRMLALTNLLCWMAHVTYCLYFTDFVGEAVFHGDPSSDPNSEAGQLYEAGVRFGCWGMSIYAFSCSVYSMTVSKLMAWFGTRTVYITGILYYGIGMLILGLWPTRWGVLFFSTSAGILYGTLFTLPYILLANYHSKNCFRVRNGETLPLKQKRGLGTDVAIISSMVFVAQLIVSLFMGPLVDWMGTTCAVLYASTVLSFLAAIAAMFVLYV